MQLLKHIWILGLLALAMCGPTIESTEMGLASYYSDSLHGNKTASGIPYDTAALTAAHRELPLGSKARVTNLSNQKQVVVVINDRGPYNFKRIIDLSRAAARELSMLEEGIVEVKVEVFKNSN